MKQFTFLECKNCKERLLLNTIENGTGNPASGAEQLKFLAKHTYTCLSVEDIEAKKQPFDTIVETAE